MWTTERFLFSDMHPDRRYLSQSACFVRNEELAALGEAHIRVERKFRGEEPRAS